MKKYYFLLSLLVGVFYFPQALCSTITMYVINDTGHSLGLFKRDANTHGIIKDNVPNNWFSSRYTLTIETDSKANSIYEDIYIETADNGWPITGGELYITEKGFNYVPYPADPHDKIQLVASISPIHWDGKSDIVVVANFTHRPS